MRRVQILHAYQYDRLQHQVNELLGKYPGATLTWLLAPGQIDTVNQTHTDSEFFCVVDIIEPIHPKPEVNNATRQSGTRKRQPGNAGNKRSR